jgi:glyoxalase family protein
VSILGLHHITVACSVAQRTVDYYTRILGFRRTGGRAGARTGGQADRRTGGQVYFAIGDGSPGSIISFMEQPDTPQGHEGVGGTHHFALLVETRDVLLKWKRRLTDSGIAVNGPLDRHYFESIYHRDPDGTVIEIATRGAGWIRDEAPDRIGTEHKPPPVEMLKENRDRARIEAETWPDPVPEITPDMRFQRLHHITAIGADIERTHEFLHGVLGLRRVKRTSNFDMPDSFHWYWSSGQGEPGTVVTYFERPGQARVTHGPGQTHHYALAVADEAELSDWRGKLLAAGFPASPIADQVHFKSFFTQDPDGQSVELATPGPGFQRDSEERTL